MTESYPQRPWILPPDATEVLLVRHGASQAHVPGESFEMLEGHADPPLAPEGQEQARAVGARLAKDPPDALFVTTLRRTAETAAPLAEATGLEPTVIPELREVRLGDWEGGELRVRAANGDPRFQQIFVKQRWDVIPGAEPMEAFGARVRTGLERVVALTGPGRRAAAVVHGGVIGELCHQATGSQRLAFAHVENSAVSRLVVMGDGRWLLRSFNDTSHLYG
ncbi:MAG TPA: histidine phosphatase family protein [Baekduia sp.]|nr:histidine phosphatase family protein [Baekduia sp.]